MLGASIVRTALAPRPMREILLAIPDPAPDLYRLHQRVWEHAVRLVKPGVRPVFLYRVNEGIVCMRSRDFERGTVREFRSGLFGLNIAAVIQGARERAVAAGDLDAWAREKLSREGFRAREIEVLDYHVEQGVKRDKASGRSHRITLPVARLRLDLEVEDRERALLAWSDGIGRGRRFGLGMLSHWKHDRQAPIPMGLPCASRD